MDLSIVIPMHNAAATIRRTLRSLDVIALPQRVQVIVVDDGSTDDSIAIAERALTHHTFGALEIIRQPNAGSSAARNRGLDAAIGEWAYFLDSDDELLTDALGLLDGAPETCSAILAASEVVRGGRTIARWRPPRINERNAPRKLSAANPLPICNAIVRRERIVRRFDESLPYLEDWLFWLENPGIFAHPHRRGDVMLARIHVHEANKSSRFEEIGRCRATIAERQLASPDGASIGERNNWKLQRAIGCLLQRQNARWRCLAALPCSPMLYAKFLAHALAGGAVRRRDRYGPG